MSGDFQKKKMILSTLIQVNNELTKYFSFILSATKCQTARKIARSYLRWAQINICLDELQSANRKKAVIERKLENVINFMWAHQLCEDETP